MKKKKENKIKKIASNYPTTWQPHRKSRDVINLNMFDPQKQSRAEQSSELVATENRKKMNPNATTQLLSQMIRPSSSSFILLRALAHSLSQRSCLSCPYSRFFDSSRRRIGVNSKPAAATLSELVWRRTTTSEPSPRNQVKMRAISSLNYRLVAFLWRNYLIIKYLWEPYIKRKKKETTKTTTRNTYNSQFVLSVAKTIFD